MNEPLTGRAIEQFCTAVAVAVSKEELVEHKAARCLVRQCDRLAEKDRGQWRQRSMCQKTVVHTLSSQR